MVGFDAYNQASTGDVAKSLNSKATDSDHVPVVMYDGTETCPTLTARNAGGQQRMPDKENFNGVTNGMMVRRLTPLECERLQNFPDNWTKIGDWVDTKGKLHKESDSVRYKALGNSIALPFWKVLAKRISAQYDRDISMGSLFSGIGGFEKCFADINGLHNVKWSSEIEEFPIAVLKKHFGDGDVPGDFYDFSR